MALFFFSSAVRTRSGRTKGWRFFLYLNYIDFVLLACDRACEGHFLGPCFLCLVQENLVCIGQASAGWQVECLSPLVVGEGFQVGNVPGKAVVEDWILHWNVYWNE